MSANVPDALIPMLVEPDELESVLGHDGLAIVDICRPEVYAQNHIPGAVHLDYQSLVQARPPAAGLMPSVEALAAAFSALGLTRETHVVAYDDEGGGKAGRLLWTLHVLGHQRLSLLNGGLHAWANEGHPLDSSPVYPKPAEYRAADGAAYYADKEYVLAHLEDPEVVLLDARTPEEYAGTQVRAARGGHIPGAVNMNWIDAIDQPRNLRLKPPAALRETLESLGVSADKEVVVYCQTHHRSSHTFMVLRSLGYERVRGYAGAWSEWGNLSDTPVET